MPHEKLESRSTLFIFFFQPSVLYLFFVVLLVSGECAALQSPSLPNLNPLRCICMWFLLHEFESTCCILFTKRTGVLKCSNAACLFFQEKKKKTIIADSVIMLTNLSLTNECSSYSSMFLFFFFVVVVYLIFLFLLDSSTLSSLPLPFFFHPLGPFAA